MFVLGFITALAAIGIIGLIAMPKMGKLFFVKDISRLDFEETLAVIRKNVADNDHGWFITMEKDYNKTYAEKKKGELPFRLVEFKIGNSNHSYRVNRAFPAVATFMPAAIAVVGEDDGKVAVYRKNTGLMGKFFGGVIRKVMCEEVPVQMNEILKGAL